MRWIYVSLLLGAALAIPVSQGTKGLVNVRDADADADELVHNSWSARAAALVPKDADADADELVHNSWSARAAALEPKDADADDLVHNSWSARKNVAPRSADADANADADELVHNSWSARN